MKPDIFSVVPGVGRIYQCPSCQDLHLAIGPVDVRFPREAFPGLVHLVNAADAKISRPPEEFPAVSQGVFWNPSRWSLC